jgi:hypothetical protein
MLFKIFEKLDQEIMKLNVEFRAEGSSEIPKFQIKILGQSALIESNIALALNSTIDIDAYADFIWVAREKFCEILKENNLVFDELSNEIWMPDETKYISLYEGQFVNGFYAEPEYVLLSKALKAPEKNKNLIVQYISIGPTQIFLDLCKKYHVNLEDFLDD